MLQNYVAGVRAWNIVHRQPWVMNKAQLDTTLKRADILTPELSKKSPRDPCTIDILTCILEKLDPNNPRDAAIITCCTSLYYSIACSGELTVPNLKAFKLSDHVKILDIRKILLEGRAQLTSIHIPKIKINCTQGEDTFWVKQGGPTCPEAALENHIRVNNPQPHKYLFTYTFRWQRCPLTKPIFTQCITEAAREVGVPPLQGHAFRIRETLEYLLRGYSFETVKVKGR